MKLQLKNEKNWEGTKKNKQTNKQTKTDDKIIIIYFFTNIGLLVEDYIHMMLEKHSAWITQCQQDWKNVLGYSDTWIELHA